MASKSAVLEASVDPWEDVPKHDLGENPRPQYVDFVDSALGISFDLSRCS